MKDIPVVDARWQDPPRPMEMALEAIAALAPGEHVRFLIHREPLPLYRILRNNGYRHRTSTAEDGTFEIEIWREIDAT